MTFITVTIKQTLESDLLFWIIQINMLSLHKLKWNTCEVSSLFENIGSILKHSICAPDSKTVPKSKHFYYAA